jgi:hypothetical protein
MIRTGALLTHRAVGCDSAEQRKRLGDALQATLADGFERGDSPCPGQAAHRIGYEHLTRLRLGTDAGGQVDG